MSGNNQNMAAAERIAVAAYAGQSVLDDDILRCAQLAEIVSGGHAYVELGSVWTFLRFLGDEYDRAQIVSDGLGDRGKKARIRIRTVTADMGRNSLRNDGHPFACRVELAEMRKPQSPDGCVDTHAEGIGTRSRRDQALSGNISPVRPSANAKARSSNVCLAGDSDPMKLVPAFHSGTW